MALILLNPGETSGPFGQFSTDSVFGSTGHETAVIAANGKVTLDGSFNAGGDTVKILGNAGDYTASVNGSSLVLTSASGANIKIPFGTAGATIEFADASRSLAISGGALKLGTQTIATTGTTEVADGTGGTTPPPSSGDELFLTPNFDAKAGTSGDDTFIADLNQVNGLQVNTLGTGDRLGNQTSDLGGYDTLEAQLTRGSTYGDGNAPIQPRMNGVNLTMIEALQSDLPNGGFTFYQGPSNDERIKGLLTSKNTEVYFNAKDVRGHDEIWSWRSDANLTVLDLTTIETNGGHDDARNTGDITIGMGYTGSADTRWDASDLHVFFDPDFLLSGQANESAIFFYILDQDGDLAHRGTNLLEHINVDGIRFRVDGGPIITLRDPTADNALTHVNFVSRLQDELAALKAAGVVPEDTQLVVDPTFFKTTFLDDGSVSSQIPSIKLITNTDHVFTTVGFSQVEDAIGSYNVYGRVENSPPETIQLPVSVQIALEKAGEGALDVCDGGALVVGSMDKYEQGIPVFNVTVYGDESRPSILRYLDSTGYALDTINITSDNDGFPTDTYARLAIGATNDGLSLIDATTFKGDLQLGAADSDCECGTIDDLHTLLATGGGDVEFYGRISDGGPYMYNTGAGNDIVFVNIDADSLDKAGDSLAITTGDGDDYVYTYTHASGDEYPNQIILKNVDITTGKGADTVWTEGVGNFRITTGDGADTIYTDNSGLNNRSGDNGARTGAQWVFNVDMGAIGEAGWGSASNHPVSDLPGVPLQKSLIGGGKLTVTFSGAGIENGAPGYDGGGVMAYNGKDGDEGEAIAKKNGIESTVTIDVAGPNSYYGTQADVNDAIVKAINNHAVLSKVLHAWIADDNTLVVDSLIDGNFHTEDLDIAITRPVGTPDPTNALQSFFTSAMIAEANALGLNVGGTITTATVIGGADSSGNGYGMSLHNEYYSGIDNNERGATNNETVTTDIEDAFNNLNRQSSVGSFETDNIINAGNGDDVIVLSTDVPNSTSNSYWSLDGQLYDRASNETLVLTGENFGRDTVFNFQVAGVNQYVNPQAPNAPSFSLPVPNGGFDAIDVRAYLTAGVATTLENDSTGDIPSAFQNIITLQRSEVVIFDFMADFVPATSDGDGIQTFEGLTASVLASAINNSTALTNYGNLTLNGAQFTLQDDSTSGARTDSTVIMVQNDQNLGEYKFFQVTWTDDGNAATDPVATVTERGIVDFGTSLGGSAPDGTDPDNLPDVLPNTTIDEINFIGSVESNNFDGWGINQFGADTGPFA